MPTITAYHALQDGNTVLSPGGTLSLTTSFNPSNDMVRTGLIHRPLLDFRVDPSNNARNLRLTVRIGGSSIGPNPITFAGGVSRTFSEIVQHGVIELGNNDIEFELNNSSPTDGQGSLTISDVVIWYKRFVD